jgi:hypothetical protein
MAVANASATGESVFDILTTILAGKVLLRKA